MALKLKAEAWGSELAAVAFEEYPQNAKNNCPVSRALSSFDNHPHVKLL